MKIIIFVCIYLLFILVNYLSKPHENFLTYFIPFYNINSSRLIKFYENNDNNKNFFENKMIYDPIFFIKGDNSVINGFLTDLSARLIQKTNLVHTNIIQEQNNLLHILNTRKTISVITIPRYINNPDYKIKENIRLISKLNKIYFLAITKLQFNIYNIGDITFDTKIGIPRNNPMFYFYKSFLKDVNITVKNIIIYDTNEELVKDFINNKIQFIFTFSELPHSFLNNIIDNDFQNEIIILPFNLNKERINKLFKKKSSYIEISYFNLTKISLKYLPKKFGDHYYFQYKPIIPLLSIHNNLVCNISLENTIIDQIFNFLFTYRNIYRGTNLQINTIEPDYNLIRYIPFHPQIIESFKKKGYITDTDSENCKYFVGVEPCTPKTLADHNFR